MKGGGWRGGGRGPIKGEIGSLDAERGAPSGGLRVSGQGSF